MTQRELRAELERRFGRATVSNGSNGVELILDCPYCDRHKLSVNPAKRCWHCWHCGESGTLRKLLGRSVPAKIERSEPEPRPAERGQVDPGECVPLSSLSDEHEAILYLRSRGFDPAALERDFGISYCRRGRKFAGGVFDTTGTIVIPVVENGARSAWQARLLYNPDSVPEDQRGAYGFKWDDERKKFVVPPKYFTSPGFKKGEHFFNYDQAARNGFVVVTEGAFDAMRVGRCAVASFGKNVSDAQVQILQATWPVVILLLDPDAEKEQDELERRLEGRSVFGGAPTSGTKVVSVRLAGYKDAGDCPHGEVVRQIVLSAMADGVNLAKISPDNPF